MLDRRVGSVGGRWRSEAARLSVGVVDMIRRPWRGLLGGAAPAQAGTTRTVGSWTAGKGAEGAGGRGGTGQNLGWSRRAGVVVGCGCDEWEVVVGPVWRGNN